VTYITGSEPKETLLAFYRKVRPTATFWGPIAAEATDVTPQKDGVFNLLNWLSGVVMIYAFLFGAGKLILGEILVGLGFLVAGFVFGAFIYVSMNRRGWQTLGS
jgi:hypothetical protein